jgi:peroxiredoxin family protein
VEDHYKKDRGIKLKKKASIICSSDQFEKVYALFNIANGSASFGMDVTIFFTFQGLKIIMKDETGNPMVLSKNFFGKDKEQLLLKMNEKNITSLEEQFNDVRDLGVKFIACDMSMDMMDVSKEQMINGVEVGGIGTFVNEAKDSDINLFI